MLHTTETPSASSAFPGRFEQEERPSLLIIVWTRSSRGGQKGTQYHELHRAGQTGLPARSPRKTMDTQSSSKPRIPVVGS